MVYPLRLFIDTQSQTAVDGWDRPEICTHSNTQNWAITSSGSCPLPASLKSWRTVAHSTAVLLQLLQTKPHHPQVFDLLADLESGSPIALGLLDLAEFCVGGAKIEEGRSLSP